MSYDLYFLRPADCESPDTIGAILERDGAASTPDDELRKHALSTALRRIQPDLQAETLDHAQIARLQGTSEEEARAAYDHVELNEQTSRTGIQITLFGDHATLTVPYWHQGAAAEQVFTDIMRYAAVLVGEGGYRLFDPQLDEVVQDALPTARARMLAHYLATAERLPGMLEQAAQSLKPWWKFWA